MPDDHANLKELGWRQAKALAPSHCAELHELDALPALAEGEFFVVVSHDCDVTAASYEKEPFVEVAHGTILTDDPDGNLTHGKNPRALHLPCTHDEEEVHIAFRADDRHRLDRTLLEGKEPLDTFEIDSQARRTFRNWLADRYSREAFADEFNRRIAHTTDKIEDKLRKKGRDLSGIYLLVRDEELPPETDYEVDIVGTMRSHEYGDMDRREVVETAIAQMEALLAKADGIRVGRATVVSEGDLSIADVRVLKRWDYDALSLREEPAAPLPPGR